MTLMIKSTRWFCLCLWISLGGIVTVGALGSWVWWGDWPEPKTAGFLWEPDVIVVLGGGNEERPREALRTADLYPDVPLVVTGDGGFICQALLKGGLPASRIIHETKATSTIENAEFTDSILTRLSGKRILIVTNWFHAPRALAVFRHDQPDRQFAASFEPRPVVLNGWQQLVSRRERAAVLQHMIWHQIWSF